MTIIEAVDQFCGGGAFSCGLTDATDELGYQVHLTAINHWKIAIETYKRNHPGATPLEENLDNVDPRKVVPGGHLDILVSSPECTYHSNAAGGAPVNDQSRSTAWHVLRWADALWIENILVENVPEFQDWGPLDREKKRIKKQKGKIYLSFLDQLKSLGYNVDARVLCCADYGDATTRKRLFIQARRDKAVIWPEATHARKDQQDLFGDRLPWRAAREIIDWSLKGSSIFTRKKPLKPNTMRRIIKGLQKYSGLPFVVGIEGKEVGSETHPTAGQIEPYIVKFYGTNNAASIDEPLPTVTAVGQHFAVCQPYLVEYHGSNRSGGERVRSLEEPMPAVATSNQFALCEPYLVTCNHGDAPNRSYAIDQPMPTVTSVDAWGIAQPFLVSYYGNGQPQSVDDPLDTVTSSDRFGLVVPLVDGYAVVDILFRMLQPHELAGAQSFPVGYDFAGNREEKVKQIGNAVPRLTGKALCKTILSDLEKEG